MTFFPSTFITIFAVLYCACSRNVMNSKWPEIQSVWKTSQSLIFKQFEVVWGYWGHLKLLRSFEATEVIWCHLRQLRSFRGYWGHLRLLRHFKIQMRLFLVIFKHYVESQQQKYSRILPTFFDCSYMVSVYSQLISLNFSPENLSIEWSFLGVRWRRGVSSIFNSLQPPFTCIIIFFRSPAGRLLSFYE